MAAAHRATAQASPLRLVLLILLSGRPGGLAGQGTPPAANSPAGHLLRAQDLPCLHRLGRRPNRPPEPLPAGDAIAPDAYAFETLLRRLAATPR